MNVIESLNSQLASSESLIREETAKDLSDSFWGLFNKETWPNELGTTQRVLTVPHPLTDEKEWSDTQVNSLLTTPRTERSYFLCQKAVPSDRICLHVNDLIPKIQEVIKELKRRVCFSQHRRALCEYSRIVENKVVSGVANSCTEFAPMMPTERFSTRLLEREHFDFSEVFITQGKLPKGVSEELKFLPRRWKLENDEWVEIKPFTEDGTRISEEYLRAKVQDTVVFSPDVMRFSLPSILREPNVQPKDRVADIMWLNVLNTDPTSDYYNPDGSWGYFRAMMMSASVPLNPTVGAVIRHLI